MSMLTEHIDRLAHLAYSIKNNAAAAGRSQDGIPFVESSSSAGPFTRAALSASILDLIRDIEPSEIGLFTLVTDNPVTIPTHPVSSEEPVAGTLSLQRSEVKRVALPIATPLRKPPSGMQRREGGQRITEYDPEIYANAALKYLDRYQSIRPMPRFVEKAESLLGHIATVRENISTLNETLKQLSDVTSETNVSPEFKIQEEENRIADAQAKIAALKKHKEALLAKRRAGARTGLRTASGSKHKVSEPAANVPSTDAQENDFWTTPGAPARTLRFTGDLLTEEQMDLGDPSFSSPMMGSQPPAFPRTGRQSRAMQFTTKDVSFSTEESVRPHAETRPASAPDSPGDEEDADETVILKQKPSDVRHTPERDEPVETAKLSTSAPKPNAQSSRHKVKVTTELERIVAKIWSTIGDSISPGHTYDVSGASDNKPPRAKETIAHLQSISTQSPSPDSPSVSSLSSLSVAQTGSGPPTAQQILTARILLALLEAPTDHSMPLNVLKEVVSTNDKGAAFGSVTRPIYACVAKRLLKIERGGGEQVVKFDI